MTAPGSGAETIPFLKTWVNLPMAIGFTVIYAKVQRLLLSPCLLHTVMLLMSTCCQQQSSKVGAGSLYPYSAGHAVNKWLSFVLAYLQLANVLSTEQLFYACILPFIAFFGAFAFIMYPLRDTLHPTGIVALLTGLASRHCLVEQSGAKISS